MTRPKPVLLAILDGWGEEAPSPHNAIALAKTPAMTRLKNTFPHTVLNASELHVGLPEGQMGNSEVGHMNIGSGRVVMQELPRIDAAIADNSLAHNPQLRAFITALKQSGGACHLMGLLSPGGVHAHQAHMAYLARVVAEAGVKVWIHAFLDGRDTPPKSALSYIEAFENAIAGSGAHIATVSGRYYAMDRDKRWERVQAAYSMIVNTSTKRPEHVLNAMDAIKRSYEKDRNSDEFLLPTAIGNFPGMHDGDGVLMANFRADRAREILEALLLPGFQGFQREKTIRFAAALGMVEYSETLSPHLTTLFPPQPLTHILGQIVADAGLTQLRIAETEKYAHVTFFFNGGREQEFPGEDRILVPSPNVATYDMQPEMSAREVTGRLLEAIAQERYDFIVVNYANTDMVGHTGNVGATIKAVETVDECIGRLSEAVLAHGGAMLITADHGNAESLFDEHTHQPHTAHTLNLVPAILVEERLRGTALKLREGRLADIAPTLLEWLQLPKPAAMTGVSLMPHA